MNFWRPLKFTKLRHLEEPSKSVSVDRVSSRKCCSCWRKLQLHADTSLGWRRANMVQRGGENPAFGDCGPRDRRDLQTEPSLSFRERCFSPESFGQACRSGHRKSERRRSEEHTSELQSLMRISYDVFCLTKKKKEQSRNKEEEEG